jgi:hypothetical protein
MGKPQVSQIRSHSFLWNWWDACIAFLAALLSAYDIVAPFKDFGVIKHEFFLPFFLLVFLVFGSIAVSRARTELNSYLTTLPNLTVIGKPEWESKTWKDGTFAHVLGIVIKNIPKHPSEKGSAIKVFATVKWTNANRQFIKENHGRWFYTNRQRNELKEELLTVDIYPNEQQVKLHFAKKTPDGIHFYAWGRENDESEEHFDLSDGWYKVHITLSDSRGLHWAFDYDVEARREVDQEWMNKNRPPEPEPIPSI